MRAYLQDNRLILILCFLFVLSGLLRLNDLSLYTDSDRYVIWGTSLAQGKGFVDFTQPDPERYVVNAPLYSVLLASAMLFAPNSLTAAKTLTLIFGALAILLFYRWLTHRFSKPTSFFIAFLLAVSPMMMVISSEVLSEPVFLALLFFLLPTFEKLSSGEYPASRVSFLLPLVVLGLLPLLREVAVCVIAASCVSFAVYRQWKSLGITAGLTILFVGGWAVRNLFLVGVPITSQDPNFAFIFQHHVTPATASTLEELWSRVILNVRQYKLESGGSALYLFPSNLIVAPGSIFKGLARLIQYVQILFPFVVAPLFFAGILADIRRNGAWMWRLMLLASYVAIVLVYPVHDMRFVLPLIPFLLFYLSHGLLWCASTIPLPRKQIRVAGMLGCVAVLIPNVVADFEIIRTNLRYRHSPLEFYRDAKAKGSRNEYFTHPWSMAGEWFEEHSSPSVVIASASKGLATFLNGRKLLEINSAIPMPTFERMIRENAVEYVASPTIFDGFHAYEQFVGNSTRLRFERAVDFGDIRIWKMTSRVMGAQEENSSLSDSTAATMMAAGYGQLLLDKPSEAASFFDRAARAYPSNASIQFFQFVASTFGRNSEQSTQFMQVLFSLPQSTSYQRASRNYLETQRKLLAAERLADRQSRSEILLECAQFYWNYGFAARARSLLEECLETNPSFFTGLLWAFDYAHQSGDRTNAKKYLVALRHIDPTNRVVQSFSRIEAIDIASQSSPCDAFADARLDIAKAFADVELFDSAVGEAERAVNSQTPASVLASLWLAEFYESRGNLRAALRCLHTAIASNPSLAVQDKINVLTRKINE